MKKPKLVILTTLIAFGVYFVLDEMYFRSLRSSMNAVFNQISISHILTYAVLGFPIIIGTWYLHGRRQILSKLGLQESLGKAILFTLICTLPMFLGYGFLFDFNSKISLDRILISVFAAAFFEELLYRGFLFGQIFRFTKVGFIPSVLIGAVLFGIVHIYQGSGIGESIGVFLVTFAGGVLFSWLYAEWNYNLWVPIFLHVFMNLSWELFSAGSNALGDFYSNVFRSITIALSIILTLRYKRKKGIPLNVVKERLF